MADGGEERNYRGWAPFPFPAGVVAPSLPSPGCPGKRSIFLLKKKLANFPEGEEGKEEAEQEGEESKKKEEAGQEGGGREG